MGAGTYGSVLLWVRQDRNGNIVDVSEDRVTCDKTRLTSWQRMVTKDARVTDSIMNEPGAWALVDGVHVPMEIHAPRLLAGKEGSETIQRIRGWREHPSLAVYRVLMDFYPSGDLWTLRTEGTYEGHMQGLLPVVPRLPTPFIWYTFECLAKAGCLMASTLSPNTWTAD